MNYMKSWSIVSPLSCAVGALVSHEIFSSLHKPDYQFALTPPAEMLYLEHPDGEIYRQKLTQQPTMFVAGSHSVAITVPSGSLMADGAAPLLSSD
jgi:hypothetical protein